MKRLAERIGPLGLRIGGRRARRPTSRSPCGVNATSDGVVRDPSALGITVGFPASVAAITELVVPRSMPTAVAISNLLSASWAAPMGSPVGLRPVGYIDPAGPGC